MPPRKPKPGRPRVPDSERATAINVSVTAAIRRYLAGVDDRPSRAVRLVLEEAMRAGLLAKQ